MTSESVHDDSVDAKDVLFDLLIVGGGIVGSGVARDASLRGLSVVLVEQEDLSSGTSSRSSRLIHGGLRYLDTYDFGLVYKDLKEREKLLRIAPHLVHPLKFVVPSYDRSTYQRLRLKAGMVLYDLLSFGKTLPSHKMLSPEEIGGTEQSLLKGGLQGGAVFYDCQAPFVERLCVENAISASEKGATILTHSRVVNVKRDSSKNLNLSTIEDLRSGKKFGIQSRAVVDATGPWVDELISRLNSKTRSNERIRMTKGIHVVIPKLNSTAIVLYALSDQRLFFVIPWLDYTLIGTTDTDYSGNPGESEATTQDVEYLIKESSRFVPEIAGQPVLFSYSGVRPLVRKDVNKSESEVSRNYKIIDDSSKEFGINISILGVKITSYRVASKEAVDLLTKKLGRVVPCGTDRDPLPGGRGILNFREFEADNIAKLADLGLIEPQARYLLNIYGSRVDKLIEIADSDRKLLETICPKNPDIAAQIFLAVKEEFAATVSDFLLRRSMIGFSRCHGLDCAGMVAKIMGNLLGWDSQKIDREIEDYRLALNRQLTIYPEPKT
jgi:glycerol-3-phosphate dehydrogenase